MTLSFSQIDPPARLLMGAGPANVHPRILRAMAADVIGQMDPEMTAYMDETMALYREVERKRRCLNSSHDQSSYAGCCLKKKQSTRKHTYSTHNKRP